MTTPPATLAPMPPPISTAAPAANTYTDLNGLAALKNSPNSPEAIRAVSQQVEALFLQMMLKSMRDAGAAGGEPESNETSMYQDMFDKQVALTLSKHQDLGLGRLFERQLGPKAGPSSPASPPATSAPATRPRTSRTGADGQRQAAGGSAVSAEHAAQFVAQVLPTIRRAAGVLGVNPLGRLAQAALETGWGQRMPRTADGNPSLNMFGIKADPDWNGARAVADTVEFSGGVATPRRTAFRAYGSIEESVSDFAQLLSQSPRYRDAISAGDDAQAYIRSIATSGYATDPDYGVKLNQILNGSTLKAALNVRVAAL
jgi:peptidoglycan hydrolase FlgJ